MKWSLGEVVLHDGSGVAPAVFHSGKPMHVDIHYVAHQPVENPVFGFSIKTGNGVYIYGSNTQIQQIRVPRIEGEGVVRLKLDPLDLIQGNFFLSLSMHSWDHAVQYHRREDWYPFAVKNVESDQGLIRISSGWDVAYRSDGSA